MTLKTKVVLTITLYALASVASVATAASIEDELNVNIPSGAIRKLSAAPYDTHDVQLVRPHVYDLDDDVCNHYCSQAEWSYGFQFTDEWCFCYDCVHN